jgi:hypothetical protein
MAPGIPGLVFKIHLIYQVRFIQLPLPFSTFFVLMMKEAMNADVIYNKSTHKSIAE